MSALQLIQRRFEVEAPVERAWAVLSDVESWPRWARHIRRADLEPPGELQATSTGTFYLAGGVKSAFRMAEFDPGRSWKWIGPFLWLTLSYDHRFEALTESRTRLTWIVEAEGFAVGLLGRLFAAIYGRNLDRAIPRLQALFESGPETV